jgi:hypothetical protein
MSLNVRRGFAKVASKTKAREHIRESRVSAVVAPQVKYLTSKDGRMPWGSFPAPDFGMLRKSTGLSKPQVDRLIREYLPEERMELVKQRNNFSKQIFKLVRQSKTGELRKVLYEVSSGSVALDEVNYVSVIFGYLQLPDGLEDAEIVAGMMMKTEYIHPSLKDLISGFISSLKTLKQFDAFPDRVSLLKASLPFSEIARDVRKMRILGFRVAMSDRIKSGEVVLGEPELDDL